MWFPNLEDAQQSYKEAQDGLINLARYSNKTTKRIGIRETILETKIACDVKLRLGY